MGGQLDGSLLEPLIELYGVDDPATLIRQLIAIRDKKRELAD